MEWKKRKKLTMEALKDPREGDRFSEMLSFWVYVVKVTKSTIYTLEGNPPITFPDDAELKMQSREEFLKRFTYDRIEGAWLLLEDRDNNVGGWFESK